MPRFAQIDAVATDQLDLDQQILLGGDSDLIDAGRTWGQVVHIDLAVPLNGPQDLSGVQLSVRTRASF